MNRIILIGNGFDLAHGMKTSYRDFIDDYWRTIIEDVERKRAVHIGPHFYEDDYKCIKVEILNTPPSEDTENIMLEFDSPYDDGGNIYGKVIFNNKFLEHISNYKSDKNWVDIENEYYEKLKKCNHDEVIILNKEFEIIERLLEKYLIKTEKECNISPSIFNKISDKINLPISLFDFPKSYEKELINQVLLKAKRLKNESKDFVLDQDTKNFISDFSDETTIDDNSEASVETYFYLKQLFESKSLPQCFTLPSDVLFLNFNYTQTSSGYYNYISIHGIIHIHGELNNTENPIIFGYGDELAEDYKELENRNDNEYLKNVKSIRYLETDNYRRLLSFIESEPYQVFIMGHSCGNSDRTLLNTLFEHKNCVSIKPFYHQREDGSDNYNEIVQNISRNFTNKATMRERVVNKTYCEPLS